MDFSVTDFNVRLRTIRLREVVLAIVIGFVLNVVLVVIFPTLGESDLIIMPLFVFVLLFFIWALKGTHGLSDDFSKLFERDNRREIFYIFLINLLFVFLIVASTVSLLCTSRNLLTTAVSSICSALRAALRTTPLRCLILNLTLLTDDT